jgi:hypothetical protein
MLLCKQLNLNGLLLDVRIRPFWVLQWFATEGLVNSIDCHRG